MTGNKAPGVSHEIQQQLDFDRAHIWHPYSTTIDPPPVFHVESANGVRLKLSDGRELIDGMSSWWSVIHGYNNPQIVSAINKQLTKMPHVMFGGLTHEPAVRLAEKLVKLSPQSLEHVFFADSGSVAVEVAIKMALQYWHAKGKSHKHRLITLRGGYHGDTFGAMSVCDPVTGMHSLFSQSLANNIFASKPSCAYDSEWHDDNCAELNSLFENHAHETAAMIVEPIVQGAGGMWFYHPQYLKALAVLCKAHDVLLIFDEVATGFGRTGKMFAGEHADVTPDILCVGKALTGGYMTLAATLTTKRLADEISSAEPGVFMHGPTFMANPLACSSAIASLDLLEEGNWQRQVSSIQQQLEQELMPCATLDAVKNVRVLGAIGVIELHQPVDMKTIPHEFVSRGVWIRPFGTLLYIMPPYVISAADLSLLTSAMYEVTQLLSRR